MRGYPIYLLLIILLIGCTHGGSADPISLQTGNQSTAQVSKVNHTLFGFWTINVDPLTETVEIIPLRGTDMHLNIVTFLETWPCTDCLSVTGLTYVPPDEFMIELRITNPFYPNNHFAVFDVKGIFITDADYTFPVSGRRVAWGNDKPKLLNYEGYTTLFNPTEFPEDPDEPAWLNYTPGAFGPGGDMDATLNPFVSYGDFADWYNGLRIWKSKSADLDVRFPDWPVSFGYAIDASWAQVDGEIDELDDYPPECYAQEPKTVSMLPLDRNLDSGGLVESRIGVLVNDTQGLATISSVTVEAPDLFDGAIELSYEMDDCYYYEFLFTGAISNANGAPPGLYPILIRVTDTVQDPNLGPVEAWSIQEVGVDTGWVRTFHGCGFPEAWGLTLLNDDTVITVGTFDRETDFDPSLNKFMLSPEVYPNYQGPPDFYISRLSNSGGFINAGSFGNFEWERYIDAYADQSDNLYVIGQFLGYVDFDPGPEEHWLASNGYDDGFLVKFDPDNNYIWGIQIGGTSQDTIGAVTTDQLGNVIVTGRYDGICDFDPGLGTEWRYDGLDGSCFVLKFSNDGQFQWVNTLKETGGIDVSSDNSGNVISLAYNSTKYILNSYNAGGELQWSKSWAHRDWDYETYPPGAYGLEVDDSGNIYVVSYFIASMSMETLGDDTVYTSQGSADVFIIVFNPDGSLKWSRVWGGIDGDFATDVAIAEDGTVYILGVFSGLVDLDPTSGEFMAGNFSYGSHEFLVSLDTEGDFNWARAWGYPSAGLYGYDNFRPKMELGSEGDIFICGSAYEGADLDPGPGVSPQYGTTSDGTYIMRLAPSGLFY